jgi:hypothetical protein
MTDERLARSYQQAVAARGSADRSGCVAPEALLALARRSGSEEERLATLDHVMACERCGRELALLRAVEQAGAELGEGAPAPRESAAPVPLRARGTGARRFAVRMALAASVLVALGVVFGVLRGPAERQDVMRGDGAAVVPTRPAPGETVRPPVVFAWQPVPGASRYTVEVLAPDGSVAWTAETTEPTATLSDARALAAGAEYRWWVRVTGGPAHDGRSDPRPLRVRAE